MIECDCRCGYRQCNVCEENYCVKCKGKWKFKNNYTFLRAQLGKLTYKCPECITELVGKL